MITAVDSYQRRQYLYAQIGMLCGTLCFLCVLVTFTYLIVHGHTGAASSILGTGVLAIVAQMVNARLSKGK